MSSGIITYPTHFRSRTGLNKGQYCPPRLFCVCTDSQFDILRKKRTGCWIDNVFVGIVGYADDLLLLSPTMDGLQEMVRTCEEFANYHNLKFSTHHILKKCKQSALRLFTKKKSDLMNIIINKKVLPWVESAKHLGCKIRNDIHGLAKDIMEKRARYINRANELNQELYFAHKQHIQYVILRVSDMGLV